MAGTAGDPGRGPRRLAIDGCAIATVAASGAEYARGHVIVENDRITAVGEGPAPGDVSASRIDGSGCLATPGLVNTHHHLYQWATRGLVQQGTLFEWLSELYPTWAHLDAGIVDAAARAGLATLLASGCSTTTDHHYVFPRNGGDVLGSTVEAASSLGVRFHPCRGSMDLGESAGGLPPDSITEKIDEALAATDDAVTRYHDASPGSMLSVAAAPCSPFSATADLMRETAVLARRRGVRMHTHLAETTDEEHYCREHFGCSPLEYAEQLGWLGDDVWLAHGVHLSEADTARLAETGTGVAHCPSSNARLGAGIAPVRTLLATGVPVGLGVDGAASNESGRLAPEMRSAALAARVAGSGEPGRGGDPTALTARQALAIATMGGARCLGRADELGSLEPGKLADIALWRIDDVGHAGIADPLAALVFGATPGVDTLIVHGRPVVEGGELRTASTAEIAAAARTESERLLRRAGTAE